MCKMLIFQIIPVFVFFPDDLCKFLQMIKMGEDFHIMDTLKLLEKQSYIESKRVRIKYLDNIDCLKIIIFQTFKITTSK